MANACKLFRRHCKYAIIMCGRIVVTILNFFEFHQVQLKIRHLIICKVWFANKVSEAKQETHTYAHTNAHMYNNVCVCVCVFVCMRVRDRKQSLLSFILDVGELWVNRDIFFSGFMSLNFVSISNKVLYTHDFTSGSLQKKKTQQRGNTKTYIIIAKHSKIV